MLERRILLNPGPATTTDSVKYAQVVPDICPREKEFGDLMKSISDDLVKIAGGDKNYECVLFGGSGTAAMDATMNSVIPRNKVVLIINNGIYGKRLVEIAKTYALDYKELFFDWNEKINIDKIEQELRKNQDIKYLAMIHHETTTGVLNPIKEIGEIAKKYKNTFIVDTISSFAGVPLNIQDYNIDFMMSTSNKCIQGMPGICFIICKKKELEKMKNYPGKSLYLNLYDQYQFFKEKHQTRFTPPVQTLYALRKSIDEFFEEGAENRYNRYKKNCEILVNGMKELGFKKIYNNRKESNLLTTFWEPDNPNYSFYKMHVLLYAKGFTIYPGVIKEKTFRLANMGAINSNDINNFLQAMKQTMNEMNLNLK